MSDVEIAARPPKQRWYKSLFVQVLIGIALGITTGLLFPEFSHHLAPLGEGFRTELEVAHADLRSGPGRVPCDPDVLHRCYAAGPTRSSGMIGA